MRKFIAAIIALGLIALICDFAMAQGPGHRPPARHDGNRGSYGTGYRPAPPPPSHYRPAPPPPSHYRPAPPPPSHYRPAPPPPYYYRPVPPPYYRPVPPPPVYYYPGYYYPSTGLYYNTSGFGISISL